MRQFLLVVCVGLLVVSTAFSLWSVAHACEHSPDEAFGLAVVLGFMAWLGYMILRGLFDDKTWD